jgi:hypothetical protein
VTGIRVPEGAIIAPNPDVTYGIVYAEFMAPAMPVPSSLFSFAGRAFALYLFSDYQELGSYTFGRPIEITLEYDPQLVPDTGDLRLYYYDTVSGRWTDAGLSVVGVDEVQHTFTVSVPHLTELAAGLPAHGGEDPAITPRLFLPAMHKP